MITTIRSVNPVEGYQPGGGSPGNTTSFLVPGEAVEATVVHAQDTGSLVILVKGIPIEATSQVGRLQVGQVLQARVEQGDGQILRRVGPQAQIPGTTLTVTGQANEGDPVTTLLRSLLPAGNSLVASLEKLVQTVRASAENGVVPQETVSGLADLVDRLQLKPDQLSADSVRQALQAVGLDYEHAVSERVAQGQPLGNVALPASLKAWLLSAVAEQGSAVAVRTLPVDRLLEGLKTALRQGAAPDQIEDQLLLLRERLNQGVDASTADRVTQVLTRLLEQLPAQERSPGVRQLTGRRSLPHPSGESLSSLPARPGEPLPSQTSGLASVMGELLDALQEAGGNQSLEAVTINRLTRSIKELLTRGGEADQLERQLTLLHERVAAVTQPETLVKAKQEVQALFVALDRVEARPGDPVWLATAKSRLAMILSDLSKGQTSEQASPASLSGWMREAHEVLRMIERTQVVNAMNAQNGQPLVFELPLGFPGASSVRVHVERRDEGGGTSSELGSRPYRVVTMLDVEHIGAIRVDALFTGKHVSARVFVDRPEVERVVTAMLPILHAGLSAKGFTVEGLSASVAETRSVKGEDLAVKAVPHRRLVNLTA
ncbi:MAG: flagellar hook-length control protein FliK [Nitrospirae bacterium]|nr:flagellar hook-length control protein FliK [Nitrospirota bacterium]